MPAVPPGGRRECRHRVPGAGSTGLAWLLDHCPPDYRLYPAWRRHPVALAWLAVRHLDAQLEAMRSSYREVRVALVDDIGPEGSPRSSPTSSARACGWWRPRRAAGLLLDALRGLEFVPRL